MKELNRYMCEYCNTEYKEKDVAEKCEANHKHNAKIVKMRYLPLKNNKSGYPVSIDVTFEDGMTVMYKRC